MSSLSTSAVIGPNFWNIRGSFPVLGGMVDVKTHMSLIKLSSGKFLVVDAIDLKPPVRSVIDELTDNGNLIESVIAVHPFHTVYFPAMYALYPKAKYYGTPRHLRNFPSIPWAGSFEDQNILKKWESDGVFMKIPEGAEFVNPEESNHFSSVLVYHKESRTIHSDDTINYFEKPGFLIRMIGKKDKTMEFWDLKKGLNKSEDAPMQFKGFIEKLLNDWDFDNICAAHTGNKISGAKELLVDLLKKSDKEFFELSKLWKTTKNDKL